MKKLASLLIFTCVMAFSFTAGAQMLKKTTQEVKKGAKKTAHKTAEVASKGKARVTDNVYKGKIGPNGQTIYIDDHSRYYWIDKKGHRNYVTESDLKNKSKK